jgi:hypothetical protein
MTMLVVAPPWTTALSINLRCTTPVLPIAIGRPSSPPLPPLPKAAVNARRQQTASAEIPIASDAQLRHTSRGFLPWRFSDVMGRHPKTFTNPEVAASLDHLVDERQQGRRYSGEAYGQGIFRAFIEAHL